MLSSPQSWHSRGREAEILPSQPRRAPDPILAKSSRYGILPGDGMSWGRTTGKMAIKTMVLTALMLGGASAAWADDRLDWAMPLAGEWTLAGVNDGDPYCAVRLGDEGVIGGADIELSATCLRNYPLDEVAGWTLRDGDIVLIDALRQAVLAFAAFDDDIYGAAIDEFRRVALSRGAPDVPGAMDELLSGSFTLSGPDNSEPCGFMLEAQSATEGSISQEGACPASWKAKPWQLWKAEGDTVSFLAGDGSPILTMTLADGLTFTADGPDGPLYFGPGQIVVE